MCNEAIVDAVAKAIIAWVGRGVPSPDYITNADELARLAIEAYEAAAWQPIETAPKDEEIWVSDGAYVTKAIWAEGYYTTETVGWVNPAWVDSTIDMELSPQPTHYRLLPKPPKE